MKVYHFHNGTGGGVISVIKNLLKFSTNSGIENHIIYTINKAEIPEYLFKSIEGVHSQQAFYYSPQWNFYYTCKQLSKLLPDDKVVIVAHDWLELGMASNLGLQNTVVQFLHGDYDYYYDLAKKNKKSIDRFITVSPVIYKKLCLAISGRKEDSIYCRFPVPHIEVANKQNVILKIFYCVRRLDDERKQFAILPAINAKLLSKGVNVHWTIIGDALSKEKVEDLMNQHTGISFFSSLPNEEVIKLMQGHDIFILPSTQEGFPVAAVEAMKAGMVPLVTNWNGATEELIVNGESGYYFAIGDAEGYANAIALLDADRKLLRQLAANGIKKANELFDPYENTKKIEDVIEKAHSVKKQKKPFKAYGSRLDEPWLGNTITPFIRNSFPKKLNT